MSKSPSRQRGQAMVEFALVLPIMMLVIVGILEASRLVFMYASVVNASREGSRYGSAYGLNDANIPRYKDCAGIRAAAQRVAFLIGSNATVTITYDHGPGTSVFDTCNGDTDAAVDLQTSDRIIVKVDANYSPMTPLIPLSSRTITSTSIRTVIGVMSIHPH